MSFYKAKWGGLNSSVNVRLLSDDDAYDLSNFSLDEIGSIKERDLFGQYNSTSGILGSNFITGLFKHYTSTSKYFIACAGSKTGLGSGGTFSDISNTSSTVTSSKYWSGVTFNNNFYMFNPSIGMQVYDTAHANIYSSVSAPGTNCSYSAIHKARVWAARSDSLPYRLYWSSLNNGNDWATTGGSADLPDITQEITGIISWGGYLYVFSETNIYILLGSIPNDFSLRKTNSMVGAIAPRSIKITDVGLCFLSRSGVYAFDGNNSNKISVKIDGTINNISKTLIQNACAIYDGKRYWLSYTPQGSSYNNRIIIYDILLKDWTIYQGDACNASYFERAYGGTDKGELYSGSSVPNGIVYLLQSASGTESISHSTRTNFLTGATFNTVVNNSENAPSTQLFGREHTQDINTKLLLHFNGSNNAVSTDDLSSSSHPVTFFNSAKLSTSNALFGSASISLDATTTDYLTMPDSADWDVFDLTTDNWTIAMWVKHTAVATTQYYITQRLNGANFWDFYHKADNTIQVTLVDAGATEISLNGGSIASTGTWYHVALCKVGSSYGLYVNGQIVAYASDSDVGNFSAQVFIGQEGSGVSHMNGYIDELIIQHSNIYNASPDAALSNTIPYNQYAYGGNLNSSNIQINALSSLSLGAISWIDILPTNTKVTFQTRSGATSDSVYFNGWQYWSSASTVTLSTVTDGTAIFTSSTNNGSFTIKKPYPAQTRDVLYYEDEDTVSVNSVSINTVGAASTNKYIEAFIPTTNLSSYDWLAGWYKSPATGNSVEFYIGEGVSSGNYVTFNTVNPNTWEKWYWYIGGITSTNRDNINYIKYRYKGDVAGGLSFGEVSAYNLYDSGDTMSSTPNDWIQYRAILGTNSITQTPQLSSVTLIYAPVAGTSEASLSSYYYTKWFDFKTPQINKQFDSLVLEVNTTTASTVTGSSALCRIFCDYDIDFGIKTGTLTFTPSTTANTVRILKNFPSSTYGKAMRLKIYNDDKDATITIKGAEIRYRQEPVTPD